MKYIRLIKLLYFADREYLAENGDMITRDLVFAMKYGPVLSCTLNLIKARDSNAAQWARYFEKQGNDILLCRDPGHGDLCRAITEKLDSVHERFKNTDNFDLVGKTHELPEWKEFYREGHSTLIPWERILVAQDRDEMIEVAEENIKFVNFNNELFSE